MLFATIEVLNNQNENWHTDFSVWSRFTKKDYDNGKITDKDIINERYGCNFSDHDVEYQECYDGMYEYRVESVMDITKEEHDVLARLGLSYFDAEENS